MIELGLDASVLVAGAAALVAVTWGAALSVRSAALGPQWALDHLRTVRPVWPALAVAGMAVAFVVRPVWIGLALVYMALTLWFMAGTLLRNLRRVDEAGGLTEVPPERRRAILRRARRVLLWGGAVTALVGVAALSAGVIGWVIVSLGAVLAGTALILGNPGDLAA